MTGGANAGRSGTTSKAEAEARAEDHDGVVVQAADGADGWYALAGTPALTNADIESARAANDPNTLEPIVEIELTPAGTAAFSELTRELAQRGADQAPDGDEMAALQHLAIVRRRSAGLGSLHRLPGRSRRDRRRPRRADLG